MSMQSLMRVFPPLLLLVNGLIYAWVAWLFLSDPVAWFAEVGVSLRSDVGYTELRAVYGGFLAAFAVFLLLCSWSRTYQAAGVVLLVLSYLGLVAARSWGILVEEQYNPLILQIYIAEWLSLVLSIAAWFCISRR